MRMTVYIAIAAIWSLPCLADQDSLANQIETLSYDLDNSFDPNGPVLDYMNFSQILVNKCELVSNTLVFSDSGRVTSIQFRFNLSDTEIEQQNGAPYAYSFVGVVNDQDVALGNIKFSSGDSLRKDEKTVDFQPGASLQDYLVRRPTQFPSYKRFEHLMTYAPSEQTVSDLADAIQAYKSDYCAG